MTEGFFTRNMNHEILADKFSGTKILGREEDFKEPGNWVSGMVLFFNIVIFYFRFLTLSSDGIIPTQKFI